MVAPLSSNTALAVEQLSKIYPLYAKPTDRLLELLLHRRRHTPFVALDQLSFSLAKGRTLGIVGENGSGKSTLLQLIAGTLTPSSGQIHRQGKVLALLELGIGFHPDFTGRQNLFFYADILGLSRQYLQSKLTEIIEFSELGVFIERPLKTYSTGMKMRLAFALVASLEPDILIIDEALAVGDVHFQKKCIDRMMDIRAGGCTILFCSHSSYQVSMFCDEVIWLKAGRMQMHDTPARVLPHYEAYQLSKDCPPAELQASHGGTPALITALEILSPLPLQPHGDLSIRIVVECPRPDTPYHVSLSLKLEDGRGVYVTATHLQGMAPLQGLHREIYIHFPALPLLAGIYILHARAFDDQGLLVYHEKLITDLEILKTSEERGFLKLVHQWQIA